MRKYIYHIYSNTRIQFSIICSRRWSANIRWQEVGEKPSSADTRLPFWHSQTLRTNLQWRRWRVFGIGQIQSILLKYLTKRDFRDQPRTHWKKSFSQVITAIYSLFHWFKWWKQLTNTYLCFSGKTSEILQVTTKRGNWQTGVPGNAWHHVELFSVLPRSSAGAGVSFRSQLTYSLLLVSSVYNFDSFSMFCGLQRQQSLRWCRP